mmetsp:Transcript_21706/g.32307  ORF Transcript_21706/g.32307 Transcript_21706/m.32307 type:complete len:86 (+) Transcript_21706:432-689(+)
MVPCCPFIFKQHHISLGLAIGSGGDDDEQLTLSRTSMGSTIMDIWRGKDLNGRLSVNVLLPSTTTRASKFSRCYWVGLRVHVLKN